MGSTGSLEFDETYQVHINERSFNEDTIIQKNKLKLQVSLKNNKNDSKFMKNILFKHAITPKKKIII